MLSPFSRGPGEAVFVMYLFDFDGISRTYVTFTVAMDTVTIPIQAVRLTLGAVLKCTFS